MDGLEWDLEQCRVSEAEPMSKYGAMEMDCMKRFYVHSGCDKRIFIRLREHLHCRFYIARNVRLKLLRIYFHGLVPGLGFAGLGFAPSATISALGFSPRIMKGASLREIVIQGAPFQHFPSSHPFKTYTRPFWSVTRILKNVTFDFYMW
jgi:hypothetical protein